MARKSKKKETERTFLHEFFGIVSLTASVLLFLSLISYSPDDPSLNSASSQETVHNLIGVVGSYGADILFSLLGLGSFTFAAVFLITAYLIFSRKRETVSTSDFVLLLIFLVMNTILFQLQWEEISFKGTKILSGGLLGGFLGGILQKYLSHTGAYLVVISLGLMAFVWATKVSLLEWINKSMDFFAYMAELIQSRYIIYSARIEKWQEQKEKEQIVKEKETKKKSPKINVRRVSAETVEEEPDEIIEEKQVEAKPLIKAIKKPKLASSQEEQLEFNKLSGSYKLPPISLLESEDQKHIQVDEDVLKNNSRILEKKLLDFQVEGRVTEIHPGPVVTMYEFEPASGVKVNKIVNLEDDLSLAMGGRLVRIVAPLPNKAAVGIEIPNHERETVYLKDIISDTKFQKSPSKLTLALGKDIEGNTVISDLQKMPHLLVAGATGAGKSVCTNSLILSILYKAKPEEVRFIFIDPKMLELSIYDGIPHLLLPVVTNPKKASLALRWAIVEMERRYKLLSDVNVRNIEGYNKKFEKENLKGKEILNGEAGPDGSPFKHEELLPYIVIVVDEFADLMMVAGREVEECVTRLAQMARAAGIHLIIATQRPSVDVITGIIKANFPTRISFKVTSKHDSRTILDRVGAEHLLGMGDMLMVPPGLARLTRVHGAFVSDQEIVRVVKLLKEQAEPEYNEEILKIQEKADSIDFDGGDEELDELYDRAVAIVAEAKTASISMVQRRLRIGYNRAARLIESMEQQGVVGPPDGAKGRKVLINEIPPAETA